MKKYCIGLVILLVMGCVEGCNGKVDNSNDRISSVREDEVEHICLDQSVSLQEQKEIAQRGIEMAKQYQKIWQEVKQKQGVSEKIEEVLKQMGDAGYIIIDDEGQYNMQNADKMEDFCSEAMNGKEGLITVYRIIDDHFISQIDFKSLNKAVEVTKTSIQWENEEEPKATYISRYEAAYWNYTNKGYLIFERKISDTYEGPCKYDALRIKPLDEKCREYGNTYLTGMGYYNNQLFTKNWSEEDFEQLDLVDLYEELYMLKFGHNLEENLDENWISQETFEEVVESYFNITTSQMRQSPKYDMQKQAYLLYKRGSGDCISPQGILPEVVSYKENENGTITLKVEAVWIQRRTDCAFAHEVIIRPGENGHFQYVANKVIPAETNEFPTYIKID